MPVLRRTKHQATRGHGGKDESVSIPDSLRWLDNTSALLLHPCPVSASFQRAVSWFRKGVIDWQQRMSRWSCFWTRTWVDSDACFRPSWTCMQRIWWCLQEGYNLLIIISVRCLLRVAARPRSLLEFTAQQFQSSAHVNCSNLRSSSCRLTWFQYSTVAWFCSGHSLLQPYLLLFEIA